MIDNFTHAIRAVSNYRGLKQTYFIITFNSVNYNIFKRVDEVSILRKEEVQRDDRNWGVV